MQPSAMPPPQASAPPATVYVQQSSTVITPKVRCYCPWSFVIISIGVSSMSTGVLNLILANWIFGGVALGVGTIVAVLGYWMWRAKDKPALREGRVPTGPMDIFSTSSFTKSHAQQPQTSQGSMPSGFVAVPYPSAQPQGAPARQSTMREKTANV